MTKAYCNTQTTVPSSSPDSGPVHGTGEHAHTVMRLHLESEKEEQLIPAIDSKRAGGGIDHFFECIPQVNSRQIQSGKPSTRWRGYGYARVRK